MLMNVRKLTGRRCSRVLFLGYSSGFQMWDCTNLASVSEVLNHTVLRWGMSRLLVFFHYPLQMIVHSPVCDP